MAQRFLRDVRDGNMAAVQRALNNPAAIRFKEPGTERTALHIAAHNRQPDIIAELLAHNAPADAKDAQGAVPLHVAVQTGDAQTVAELLGRGNKVAVRYKNNLGYTPLHLAAKLGHTRVARELLLAGARADLKDQRGKLPADLVPRVGNTEELVELLRTAAAEKGGAGASSAGGLSPSTPVPRTPASPAPRSALSTGARASASRTPLSSRPPAPRAGSATSRTLGYQSSLQKEVVQDQIEQALSAQKGADEKIRQLHTKVGQIEPRVDQFEEAAAAQAEHNRAIRQLHSKVGQIEPRVDEVDEILTAQRNSDRALRSLHAKMEELDGVVESQRRAVEAAARIANDARDHQSSAIQELQMTLVKRQEQLTGEMRMKLNAVEGRLEAHVTAQDDLQLKVTDVESRLRMAELGGKAVATNGAVLGPASPEVARKLELLERKLAAVDRARRQDLQQLSERAGSLSSPGGPALLGSSDELGDDGFTPRTPGTNGTPGGEGASARQVRKQREVLEELQRKFGLLESRFGDYQEAQAAMAQAEMETPDFMVQLRAQLEGAASESGSGKSGSNSTSAGANSSDIRSSENGVPGGSGGSGPSAAAMGAIVAALEGLTKEVGKVRVRTAQLAERSHSTEGRLTYLEDHVTKIRNKMKQIRQWFTLTDQGDVKAMRRNRSGMLTEASTQRMPERQNMHTGPSSLRSQQSLGSVQNMHFG